MRKTINTLSFILCFFVIQQTEAQTTQRLFMGDMMNGKVKQMTETSYRIETKNNGATKTEELSTTIYSYDSDGKTLKIKTYHKKWIDGVKTLTLLQRTTYQYYQDSNGTSYVATYRDIIKRSVGKLNPMGKVIDMQFFDEKGRVVNKVTQQYSDNYLNKINFYFDKKGRLQTSTKIQYNKEGRIAETDNYDAKNKLTTTQRFHYPAVDNWNNWTKSNCENITGNKTTQFAAAREYIYYE